MQKRKGGLEERYSGIGKSKRTITEVTWSAIETNIKCLIIGIEETIKNAMLVDVIV